MEDRISRGRNVPQRLVVHPAEISNRPHQELSPIKSQKDRVKPELLRIATKHVVAASRAEKICKRFAIRELAAASRKASWKMWSATTAIPNLRTLRGVIHRAEFCGDSVVIAFDVTIP